MYEELKKHLLKSQEEYRKRVEKFVEKSKKLEVEKGIGKFDVLPNSELPLVMRKEFKEIKQMRIGMRNDIIFQTKLEKIEKMQIEYEVRHNMKRTEFENYLTKIDEIEQGRSSFGWAVKKRLEILKELKERESKGFLE